eukprot:1150190-Pelagomonas_calceolata.AAC.9
MGPVLRFSVSCWATVRQVFGSCSVVTPQVWPRLLVPSYSPGSAVEVSDLTRCCDAMRCWIDRMHTKVSRKG